MAVQAETYQPRVDPARSTPLPMQDPGGDAFAAIGEGMTRLGGELHRQDVQRYRLARQQRADSEAADFAVRFAESRAKFDAFQQQLQTDAAPGAEGYTEALRTAWQAEESVLLRGFTEASNLDRARAQLAQFGAQLESGAARWQEGQRIGKLVADQGRLSEIGANRARRAPDAYAEELTAGREAIAALGVPEDVREKLLRQHDQLVTVGFLNGLNDTNPQIAVAMLDAGQFDDVLSPQQIEQARNGAMVEVRRAEAAAAHQAGLEKAALREEVQSAKSLIGAGADVPDAHLAALQQRLTAFGDTGAATEMGVLRVQNGIRRETEPWTPAQFDSEISRLLGKADRSDAESVRLRTLQTLRPAAVATYRNNPGEWAAKNGMPPPPMAFNDAASIAGRLRWARAVETHTGRPVPPLLPAEAAALREQAASSPRGRVDVADQIAALGGFATLQAARQIAPNDPMLGRLAQLADPMLRRAAAKGGEIRASRRDVIDGVNGNDARIQFDEALGGAGALISPADLGAVFEVARNLYAARAEGTRFDDDLFDQALHEALGGTVGANGERLGGLGSHGRVPVLLPDGMSDGTFDRALARFASARMPASARPVWADGSPMTGADVVKFTPVRRPDGRYEFQDGKGARITVKDGRTWTLDIARFARELGL